MRIPMIPFIAGAVAAAIAAGPAAAQPEPTVVDKAELQFRFLPDPQRDAMFGALQIRPAGGGPVLWEGVYLNRRPMNPKDALEASAFHLTVGTDTVGDDDPDYPLYGHSGGQGCCALLYLFSYDRDAGTVRLQARFENGSDVRPEISDMDDTGSDEIVVRDDAVFAATDLPLAARFAAPVVLSWEPTTGEWRARPSLMREPPLTEKQQRRLRRDFARRLQENGADPFLWKRMQALAYEGRMPDVVEALKAAWPEDAATDLDTYLYNFGLAIGSSPHGRQLLELTRTGF